jgi:hypothetical protein
MIQWHEVVSPGGERWLINLPWLLSGYECIWGRGCEGTFNKSYPGSESSGCCGNGVCVTKPDRIQIKKKLAQMEPWEWQEHGKYRRLFDWQRQESIQTRMKKQPNGSRHTCIFHNDDDHASPGCAFHGAALRRDESPLDWKPEACITVPFKVMYDETLEATILTIIDSGRDWNGIDWWCGDDPKAWLSSTPVYRRMADELAKQVDAWDKTAWEVIVAECDRLWKVRGKEEPVTLRPSASKG